MEFGFRSRHLALALLAVLGCACTHQAPPNVVLIVIDTLRADRLGSYGNPNGMTPFLDGLAARGAVFRNAYSTTSWTCPSVASLLTSRYPSQHRVISFDSRLSDEEVTFAERLAPLHYVAGGFSANFRLLESLGYAQGFNHWFAQVTSGEDMRGPELSARALEWLDGAWRRTSDQPGLLYLQYMEPHAPYEPVEPYRSRFERREDGAGDSAALNAKLVGLHWWELTPADVHLLESLYDGEVAAIDAELQRLFAELERRGFLDRSIVIVVGDHGEEFWEHGNLMHGTTLYNETVRVPLIVVAPGVDGGQRIEENVSLVDVAPTLLDLLGLAAEPRFEGRSLVPLLRSRSATPQVATTPRDVILQLESTGDGLDTREHVDGIARGPIKLLVRPSGLTETYDLAVDPAEQHENPSGHASDTTALGEAIAQKSADLHTRSGAPVKGPALDDATREKLRALGYHF
jgi:arylsulfatase A-like enzyme